MGTKASSSLLEAIARISNFSYKPIIAKYPFIKKYLKREKDPQTEWVLWMTAAGSGYALSTKESYPGEHGELVKSVTNIGSGLSKLVENFTVSIHNAYKWDEERYQSMIGIWVITKIKNGKPTLEEANGVAQGITKLLILAIQEYEAEKVKKPRWEITFTLV